MGVEVRHAPFFERVSVPGTQAVGSGRTIVNVTPSLFHEVLYLSTTYAKRYTLRCRDSLTP
jgi:hypothetical protein